LPVAHAVGSAGFRAVGELHVESAVSGGVPVAIGVGRRIERGGGNARGVQCFQWLLSMRTSSRSGVCPRLT
jgi:hypothetical protein